MAEPRSRRGGGLFFIVGILVGIPATIFAISNLESATVEFLGWTAEVPLWAVIALSMLAGALLGVAALLTWQARRKHGRKKAAKLEAKRQKQAGAESDSSPALESSTTSSVAVDSEDGSGPGGRLPS